MSNEHEAAAEVLNTPDEWCRVESVQILDADGWRGRNGRDWDDPITLAEFRERLATCTQRSVALPAQATCKCPGFLCSCHHTQPAGEGNAPASPISDEMVLDAARAVHAFRGTGHAAIRDALEAAYPTIRQQVAEEIAAKAFAIADGHQKTAVEHREIAIEHGTETPKGQRHMRTAHSFRDQAAGAWEAAHAAREIGGTA